MAGCRRAGSNQSRSRIDSQFHRQVTLLSIPFSISIVNRWPLDRVDKLPIENASHQGRVTALLRRREIAMVTPPCRRGLSDEHSKLAATFHPRSFVPLAASRARNQFHIPAGQNDERHLLFDNGMKIDICSPSDNARHAAFSPGHHQVFTRTLANVPRA
jgi:hypothetical protein